MAATFFAASFPLRFQLVFAAQPLSKQESANAQAQGSVVSLRWGARTGVSRYRLQFARDASFTDIVFDRVVNGTTYEVTDLTPGRYFWRVAALTTKLGEYSASGVVDVSEQKTSKKATEPTQTPFTESIVAGDGWRAAVGDVKYPVLAHLRSRSSFEIVGTNAGGITYALDATTGVALWVTPALRNDGRGITPSVAPLLVQSPNGLDSVIILAGSIVRRIDGATGRELWRATLPAFASDAAVLNDKASAAIFIIDTSRRTLFILNANDGSVLDRTQLPGRVIGSPFSFDYQKTPAIILAYENGRIEIRDQSGRVLRAGETASTNSTGPLFVKGARGGLIIVGTKTGLTALGADDLRPLGRTALGDDTASETLAAGDLNGDGNAEVIMLTARGHIAAINASDGKIVWQSSAIYDAQAISLADVNHDGMLDIILAGRQVFAFALSGRDGSLLWRHNEQLPSVASSAALGRKSIVVVPSNSGTLLIAGDASGVRGMEIRKVR